MARSNNDMDKMMDLFLYMIPKYLYRISENTNNIELKKRIPLEKDKSESAFNEINKKEIKELIDMTNSLGKGNESKENKKNIASNQSKSQDNEKKETKEEDTSIKHHISKKTNRNKEKSDDNVELFNQSSEEQKNKEKKNVNIIDNEKCNICINAMVDILKNLIGEKVDISITDSTMFLLNSATVLGIQDTIVKLRTLRNTIVLIPIQEIVGIRSNSLYGINFDDSYNLNMYEKSCEREKSLREYFASRIGKRIFLQTKGDEDFKYINNRIITGTGRGIVIIEGTMMISLCKIILVEERT